ncbi:MAG TPA: SurA N-terminal domain-containing protein [Ignavibacteriaceae bacterium]|nr:SurA N-terminal domain-containing protein [Ignavibacteriaceae bacterium]
MGTMARMRSLAPAFIITVGALFVLFMVIQDSNFMSIFGGGRSNAIGKVNGKEITYKDFTDAVERQRENQKAQTGKEMDEENIDQLRDQVWEAMVTQTLLEEQMKKYGITVSDSEITQTILSDNPPQFLKQNFIDSLGRFNRQLYEQAIFDPQNKAALVNAEDLVRNSKMGEKLQSMLLATINVGEDEIRRTFINQNINMNVQYALIPLDQFPDLSFKISEEEMKNYYNKNSDQYKVPEMRKLKYVLFSNKATADDSITIEKTLENVATRFKDDTLSFKQLVDIYSAVPYSVDTLSLAAIAPAAADILYNSSKDELAGPVAGNEGYILFHVKDIVRSNDQVVRASHILINQFGSDEKNLAEATKIYNELRSGADFSEAAKKYSGDKGNALRGGSLGWFGKGKMVKEFEQAAFSGKIGEIQKPVKTAFGYHIIKVTGRTNNKYAVERIVNPVKPSASTVQAQFEAAGDFAYLADKNGFDGEAKLMDYKVQETPPFTKDSYIIPGLGNNKRLLDFAFENSLNSVSQVCKFTNGYVVAIISSVEKEHIKPFEDIKNTIKPAVLKEKKFEKAREVASDLKKKIGGDINKAKEIDPKVFVNTTGNFTANTFVPTVGKDDAFILSSLKIEPNKISDPIKGVRGYYLLRLLERSKFDSSAYELKRASIRDNLLSEKKNSYFSLWLSDLKKNADIIDNRYRYYGL